MKRHSAPMFAALALAALLSACGSTPTATTTAAPVETRKPGATTTTATTPATPSATAQSSVSTVDLAAQNAAAAARAAAASAKRIIYFDFDSYAIKDEFKPSIDVFAKLLNVDKAKKVTIEGHADERGGREYNLALGQKRAEAVAKSLGVLGASGQQVEAVSFGEERPVDTGHDEAAWAKNRRAELKDR